MKRALLLAVTLASALALLWLFARREAPHEPFALAPRTSSAEAAEVHGETLPTGLEAPAPGKQVTRERLSSDPGSSETADTASTAAENPTLVCVQVLYTGSHLPVHGAVVKLGPSQTSANTDARGRAELRMPRGSQLDLLRLDSGAGGSLFVPYEQNLDRRLEEGRIEIEVFVERGTDLRGSVVDAATRRPVARAHVRYRGLGQQTDVSSGEDGSFEIVAVLSGPWNAPGMLLVEHSSHFPKSLRPDPSDFAADAQPLVVAMERGISLEGRIVDSERMPVAGARVTLTAVGSHEVVSDEAGRFVFGALVESDQASLSVPTQSLANGAIMATTLELGPVRASLSGIEVAVPSALLLHIFAELQDGTKLTTPMYALNLLEEIPRESMAWDEQVKPGWEDLLNFYCERIVPRGPAVEIQAYARATGDSDPDAFIQGRARVSTESGIASPHAVHIVLSERMRLEIPPAPPGADVLELAGGVAPRGVLDLQLLDASSGRPIGRERKILLFGRSLLSAPEPNDKGWVRLRGIPGTYELEAELDEGPRESFTFTIPASGYAKSEWRLRTKL